MIPFSALAFLGPRTAKLAIGATLVGALGVTYWVHRNTLLETGREEVRADLRVAENARLREALRETARLTDELGKANDEYTQAKAQVDGLRVRLRAGDQRLREQAAAFERDVAAAGADGLRRYATASERNLLGCRADLERFGLEAASCSAAAHALKRELDARTGAGREKAP